MSLLFWGEHCTECAAPACYQSCDLYEPRPDTRCRRFSFGIHKNRYFRSIRGYGAEVSFKKWGVFGAMGNTAMKRKSHVLFQERLIGVSARILNAVAPLLSQMTRDSRWTYPTFGLSRRLCRWFHERNAGHAKPDAFLLEVYNPALPVKVHLAMDYAPEARSGLAHVVQLRPRFRTTVELPHGYSRHEFDRRLFQDFTETGLPFNISLTPEADSAARLVFLTADFVSYRTEKSARQMTPIKCVIWDLDNTLWEGTLLESEGVQLKACVKEILECLDQRGILLSIVSKNDHEYAWRRLEALGVSPYFLTPQINWAPKSENVKLVAKKLNIGLDSVAFVDDNAFERNEVLAACPEVMCLDIRNMEELRHGRRFQGSDTADAKNRRRYYQDALVREEKQAEFGESYVQFLAYCEIRLEVQPFRQEDFDRVAELVQRTNQLNFSGNKYTRDQLREVLSDPALLKYVLKCSDKFGTYGLVGFAMTRVSSSAIRVQDFMLSCRVQGKLIEDAFFSHIAIHHNPKGAPRLYVDFRETGRNEPARRALEAAAFQKIDGEEGLVRPVGETGGTRADVVQVVCFAGCGGHLPLQGVEASANSHGMVTSL